MYGIVSLAIYRVRVNTYVSDGFISCDIWFIYALQVSKWIKAICLSQCISVQEVCASCRCPDFCHFGAAVRTALAGLNGRGWWRHSRAIFIAASTKIGMVVVRSQVGCHGINNAIVDGTIHPGASPPWNDLSAIPVGRMGE